MPARHVQPRRMRYSRPALLLGTLAAIKLLSGGIAEARTQAACPAQLNERAHSGQTPGAVRATFMGTSTLLFDDGATQILIDGFFSRPPVHRALAGWLTPDQSRISFGLSRGGVNDRLMALFVAHAHHDHAMDAPAIAVRTHADLVGSTSVRNLAFGQGVPRDCVLLARHGVPHRYGAFTVTPIETPHSTPEMFPGNIREPRPSPTWASHFRTGTSYSFLVEHGALRILVYPSAAVERARLDGVRAEIVYLGTGGLILKTPGFVRRYWEGVVRRVGARRVIPIHWDDMGRPLDQGLRPAGWPTGLGARKRALLACLARRDGILLGDVQLFDPVVLELPLVTRPKGACVRGRNPAG